MSNKGKNLDDRTDHLGQVFDTKKDMCNHWNINYYTYKSRIKSGLTKEEALTGKLPKIIGKGTYTGRISYDHLGQVFPSAKVMCEYWNVEYYLYINRINQSHWSVEEALTGIKKESEEDIEKRTDHLGQVFSSVNDMCEYWNVEYATYQNRYYSLEWTKEEALTGTGGRKNLEERTDHLGQVFDSKKKMCEYWKVNLSTYTNRIKKGVSKEDALTGKLPKIFKKATYTGIGKKSYDHLGQVFNTEKAMCDYWEIGVETYRDRIERGLSKKDALTFVSGGAARVDEKDRTDHLGQVFPSIVAMCDYWSANVSRYSSRIKSGYSKEESLLDKDNKNYADIEDRTDHLGQVFPTQKAMCDHWNVTTNNYGARIRRKWTKEEALTGIKKHTRFEYTRTDHLGNIYKDKKELCNKYSVTEISYTDRLKRGLSKEEALNIIPMISRMTRNLQLLDNLFIEKNVYIVEKERYFKCRLNDKIVILSHDDIINIYRKENHINGSTN